MRYYVTIDGRTLEVDLRGDRPLVDGEPVDAELSRIPGTPTRHLLMDGRSYVLVGSRTEHDWDLHLNGTRLRADVVDERTRAIRAMTGHTAAHRGPRPVKAPMPGLVVRLNVEPGERVEPGQSVAIIEAMKMENDLKAESAGVVAAVHVEAGQAVEKGTVLVEFASEDAGAEDAGAEDPGE